MRETYENLAGRIEASGTTDLGDTFRVVRKPRQECRLQFRYILSPLQTLLKRYILFVKIKDTLLHGLQTGIAAQTQGMTQRTFAINFAERSTGILRGSYRGERKYKEHPKGTLVLGFTVWSYQ